MIVFETDFVITNQNHKVIRRIKVCAGTITYLFHNKHCNRPLKYALNSIYTVIVCFFGQCQVFFTEV